MINRREFLGGALAAIVAVGASGPLALAGVTNDGDGPSRLWLYHRPTRQTWFLGQCPRWQAEVAMTHAAERPDVFLAVYRPTIEADWIASG